MRANLQNRSVFVLEDETVIAMLIVDDLETLGCTVVGPAYNLRQARRILGNETAIDAALIDVNLGGETSEEIARHLSKHNIPFAYLTGHGTSALPVDFKDQPVITKPFVADDLAATLSAMLQ